VRQDPCVILFVFDGLILDGMIACHQIGGSRCYVLHLVNLILTNTVENVVLWRAHFCQKWDHALV
jgi:hypothetical protein